MTDDAKTSPNAAEMPTNAADAWAAVYIDVAEKMDAKIELKDPDHPDAEKAAEATARLLMEVREKRAADAAEQDQGKYMSPRDQHST